VSSEAAFNNRFLGGDTLCLGDGIGDGFLEYTRADTVITFEDQLSYVKTGTITYCGAMAETKWPSCNG
jgi:hypothetical protein